MFTITDNKGVRITFENGWTISIQWGPGNYCDNHDSNFGAQRGADMWQSTTAETAIISPNDEFVKYDDDEVQGYRTPAQIAALIAFVSAK